MTRLGYRLAGFALALGPMSVVGCITEDNCIGGTERIDGVCQFPDGRDAGMSGSDGGMRDGGGAFDGGQLQDGAMMCPAGMFDCGDGCVDIASSTDHCGGCGNVCEPVNAADAMCDAGTCSFMCTPGFADLDGDGSNGCEVDLMSDPMNCGMPGYDCMVGPCSMGQCVGRRVVFATSVQFSGNLGGITGAAEKCRTAASAAGLRGRFLPWLSYGRSYSPRMDFDTSFTGAYIRTDASVIAMGWDDLTTVPLRVPINLDENGVPVAYTNVWSETTPEGTYRIGTTSAFGNCEGWSVETGNGGYGRVGSVDRSWTESGGALNCNLRFGLYCFEDPPRL